MGSAPVYDSEISSSIEVVPLWQPFPQRWEYNDLAELLQVFRFATISAGAWERALPSSPAPQGEPVLAQPLLQHRLGFGEKQEDLASLWLPLWCPTNIPLTSPDTSARSHGSCEMEELWCIYRSDASFALEQFSHRSICVNLILLFPFYRTLSYFKDFNLNYK